MNGNHNSTPKLLAALLLAGSLAGAGSAMAQEHHGMGGGRPGPAMQHRAPEQFRAPQAYRPVSPPTGWDRRPPRIDHGQFNHNFRAHRTYMIGPYLRPPGWVERTWYFGDILPTAFFAPEYRLADYWLFDLETPPIGFEWVRYGRDALLIDLGSGRVEQTVYGLFG